MGKRRLLTGGASSGGGQTPVYSYTVGYDAVGNVVGASDINTSGGSVMGTWTYAYDTLNRLTAMHNTATTPASIQYANMSGCWAYDDFGNRMMQSQNSSSCPDSSQSTFLYNANNQVSGRVARVSGKQTHHDSGCPMVPILGPGNHNRLLPVIGVWREPRISLLKPGLRPPHPQNPASMGAKTPFATSQMRRFHLKS